MHRRKSNVKTYLKLMPVFSRWLRKVLLLFTLFVLAADPLYAAPDKIGVQRGVTDWRLDNGNGTWDTCTGGDTCFFGFGSPEDLPVIGDWNGDGSDEIGVYRPGNRAFYLDVNGNGTWDAGDRALAFGLKGDIPIAGNWNGDGADEIGVYRPGNRAFYLDVNGNGTWDAGDRKLAFGLKGDIPLAGDWDGNGADQIGVYRPDNASFYLDVNGNGVWDAGVDRGYDFGLKGGLPIRGDWNGDGSDEIGVYQPDNASFYLDVNGNGVWDAGVDRMYDFGLLNDVPIVGVWKAAVSNGIVPGTWGRPAGTGSSNDAICFNVSSDGTQLIGNDNSCGRNRDLALEIKAQGVGCEMRAEIQGPVTITNKKFKVTDFSSGEAQETIEGEFSAANYAEGILYNPKDGCFVRWTATQYWDIDPCLIDPRDGCFLR
jgi:hypothetical protein